MFAAASRPLWCPITRGIRPVAQHRRVCSSMSRPCTFFQIYYKYGEYEVFQTDTMREGLLGVLDGEPHFRAKALLSDDELLDYTFRLGADKLRDQAGWGLVAVVLGTKLIETPYS